MDTYLVYVTAGSAEEAARIGRAAVEERLAACANVIGGVHAVYRWQGRVEQAEEALLLLKTAGDRLPALLARVRALHAYETPCITALPLAAGDPDFLRWVEAQTRP